MAPFTVTVETTLPPDTAWQRVTDWRRHGWYVPLTRVTVPTPPPNGVGTRFVARTAIGRVGFDDPMEIVEWDAPRSCRIEKRGRVVLGWAELTVEATPTGSRTTWREEAVPAVLPRFAAGLATVSGKALFGRVLRKLLSSP